MSLARPSTCLLIVSWFARNFFGSLSSRKIVNAAKSFLVIYRRPWGFRKRWSAHDVGQNWQVIRAQCWTYNHISRQDKILGHKDVGDNGVGIRLVKKCARGDLREFPWTLSRRIGTRTRFLSVVQILVLKSQINLQFQIKQRSAGRLVGRHEYHCCMIVVLKCLRSETGVAYRSMSLQTRIAVATPLVGWCVRCQTY
jgi:hypothetical protein